MAKSKNNRFDKSNRYFDDFEDQNFKKKKSLKTKGMFEDDFQDELDSYYDGLDDNDYPESDSYDVDDYNENRYDDDEDDE